MEEIDGVVATRIWCPEEINDLLAKIESESPQAVAQPESGKSANVSDVAIEVQVKFGTGIAKIDQLRRHCFCLCSGIIRP